MPWWVTLSLGMALITVTGALQYVRARRDSVFRHANIHRFFKTVRVANSDRQYCLGLSLAVIAITILGLTVPVSRSWIWSGVTIVMAAYNTRYWHRQPTTRIEHRYTGSTD